MSGGDEHDPSRLGYFDSLYGASDDPYGVQHRWYERRKRAVLLASLPLEHYGSIFEPGCGTGALTVDLARRCDSLLAGDFSGKAVEITRQRVAGHRHVEVQQLALPQDWPVQRRYDLIVLSEVGYFLDDAAMGAVARHCASSLSPGGTLLACDWRSDFGERALSTDRVHAHLEQLGLPCIVLHQEEDFVLRVWSRDARSVAQQEGIR